MARGPPSPQRVVRGGRVEILFHTASRMSSLSLAAVGSIKKALRACGVLRARRPALLGLKPPTLLPRSAQRQEAFQELLQIGRLPRCPLRGDPRWRRQGKGLGRGFRSFKAVHRATGGFPHRLAACFTRPVGGCLGSAEPCGQRHDLPLAFFKPHGRGITDAADEIERLVEVHADVGGHMGI